MNNLELWIYLSEVIGTLNNIVIAIFIVSLFFAIVGTIVIHTEFKEDDKKLTKAFFSISFIFLLLVIFIPSQKTMYAMIGVHSIKTILLNQKVDSVAQKSILLLEQKIDELIKKKE